MWTHSTPNACRLLFALANAAPVNRTRSVCEPVATVPAKGRRNGVEVCSVAGRSAALSLRLLFQQNPLKAHSEGRSKEPESVSKVSLSRWGDSPSSCSRAVAGAFSISQSLIPPPWPRALAGWADQPWGYGAASPLRPRQDTPAQHCPRMLPTTYRHPDKQPFLSNRELHGDGRSPRCGLRLCSRLQ